MKAHRGEHEESAARRRGEHSHKEMVRRGGGKVLERKRGGKIPPQFEAHIKEEEKKAHHARKRGGKVHGEHAKHRLDKRARGGHVEHKKDGEFEHRARGGRMTPQNPLSGADNPRPDYATSRMPVDEGGEGKVSQRKRGGRTAKRARGGKLEKKDEEEHRAGGRLSYGERTKLPTSDFAIPSKRGKHGEAKAGRGAYPIPDASHARNALARVSQFGDAKEKAEVRRKVHEKFPGIG